ncbi:MAG: polysaccharide deacetylase family protein [Planctomycetota bacterium]
MKQKIGLRVDVDFAVGLNRGVPYLLDFFREKHIQASFFVAMGPDRIRSHGVRVKRPNYLKRLRHFGLWNILRRFGPAYLLKQLLGRSMKVGEGSPEILQRILDEGHELGVHGYDHFWWAENIWSATPAQVEADMRRAIECFTRATGQAPEVWASPNWRCNDDTLKLIEELDLSYGTDCRGSQPFIPTLQGRPSTKVQLPVSLPCLHEIKQALNTSSFHRITGHLMSKLDPYYNVLCTHAYYEGILARKLFNSVVESLQRTGVQFVPMRQVFENLDTDRIPCCEMTKACTPGSIGVVNHQGEESRAKPRERRRTIRKVVGTQPGWGGLPGSPAQPAPS